MKTAHISDLHECPERHKKVMRILSQVKEIMPDVELLTNSGENFNNSYAFTERNGYTEFMNIWGEITNLKPVYTIRGTQGRHEKPGMVEELSRVGVTVMQPGKDYKIGPYQLFPVPHAHKAHIMAKNKGLSRDEANAMVNKQMGDLCMKYGAMRDKTLKGIAVGHGVVQGKNTRDLKAVNQSAIYSTESDLMKINADFYAWGHYHNPTDFDLIKGGYLGSFAWNFGELDYKPAITIFDWDKMDYYRHELDINIRKKLVMVPGEVLPDLTGCDVHIVNNGTDFTAEQAKEKGAGTVKITNEVAKENKVRSKEVIEAVSYQDKFKAVYPDATDRQLKVCEEFWEADKAEGKIPQRKTIKPLWVEIHGSKNFQERLGKETVKIDFADLTEGINMLIGPGGHGKSSLIDYVSPFSILFLQSNSLLSTFEAADSYIKQAYEVNGIEYQIEKYFKPTLKNPKAEYYAYQVTNGSREEVKGTESGNRKPFDEWCVSVFGTPRKYSTSVLNTQFDDNDGAFMGQPINPSIFKATNVELKALFHELAGTDLKHLELKCKHKADEFRKVVEVEELKKAGVEENIPSTDAVQSQIATVNNEIKSKRSLLESNQTLLNAYEIQVQQVEKQEQENQKTTAVIESLRSQIVTESESMAELKKSLAELGNVNLEEINAQLSVMEAEKIIYDSKLKSLPGILKENSDLRQKHSEELESWTKKNSEVSAHNAEIDLLAAQITIARDSLKRAETRKAEKIRNAESQTIIENNRQKKDYKLQKTTLETEIETLKTRIANGEEMKAGIYTCPQCGYMDPEADAKREKYGNLIEILQVEVKVKESAEIKKPEPVKIEADTTMEDREISEANKTINQPVGEKLPVTEKPAEPVYKDEIVPIFDDARYEDLKQKIDGYSEEKEKSLREKINGIQKRIADLQVQIDSKELHTINTSVKTKFDNVEIEISIISDQIKALETSLEVHKSRLIDIEKQRESLKEYDKRIDAAREDLEFWTDMKVKWGQSGVPARILEHTGPYVDQEANHILQKYYPVYKIHSETTKLSSDGKKDLEIFNISVLNQETGREKPINSLSGEERNFVAIAMRHAFRTIAQQNSLEEWFVRYEDEPDAHVSTDYLMQFWDMIEDTTPDNVKAVCIAHSPEIKHRSAVSVDIRTV